MVHSEKIRTFWESFASRRIEIEACYEAGRFDGMAVLMDKQVHELNERLVWEVGPGKMLEYSLTISGEGDRDLRMLCQTIVDSAPQINGWEFYPARQARPAPPGISFLGKSQVSSHDWRYIAKPHSSSGRVDITILSDQFNRVPEKEALEAVQLYLDFVFGEDIVEEYLGIVSISQLSDSELSRPIAELPLVVRLLQN
jgi:hypothetical protein